MEQNDHGGFGSVPNPPALFALIVLVVVLAIAGIVIFGPQHGWT